MKAEEAIDIIKRMYKGTPTTEQYEALEKAYEALEKQLPKKPVFKRNAYGGISVCPICGVSDYGKYCRQCGQAIKYEI